MVEKTEQKNKINFKLFDLYDTSNIEIKDPALKPYINLSAKLLLKSHGRNHDRFGSSKTNVIEKLARHLDVPGHVGKKHKLITSWGSGKYNKNMKIVLEALKLIQEKTKKNPIQVLVSAIENGSPRDEVTVIEHAGARYPQAVDTSPYRRVALALRWFVQGAYNKSFGKGKKISQTLANEIIMASEGNMESFAVSKKTELEKQADGAR
ncbi:MAG: 30S ribosomal protein S7 [Candidatus Pacearchaeota archaeon]|nr:30S ribosomal protein S7 [Candidatus Pacearchaeota archaeon]